MAKILVVDDERVIRMLLQEILSSAGHSVNHAATGDEAVESVHENKPDILITDIFMPEKSGLELIMEIRRHYPDLKIIAISGDSISRAGGHKDCLDIAKCLG